MSEYLKGSSADPTIFQNSWKDSEYWPSSNPWEGKDSKEVMLDMVTVGLLVIGMRAYLDPAKYGDNDFVKNAIETNKMFGYITDEGINAPIDIMELAFPQSNGNH